MATRLASNIARSARASTPPRRGGVAFGLASAGLLLGVIVWNARSETAPGLPPPPVQARPWIEIVNPIPMFDLPNTIFGPRADYEAWRARDAIGRRDVLIFGQFGNGSNFLRLSLTRPRPGAKSQPFFAAMARQAAFAGIFVLHSQPPRGVRSRFGDLAVADALLDEAGRQRACLAFRALEPMLQISGIACAAPGRPFEGAELACALDRLNLVGGSQNNPLTGFFEQSELRRGLDCPDDVLAPVKARSTWLDPGQALPKFKTEGSRQERAARPTRRTQI